jgi:hypothetical protein
MTRPTSTMRLSQRRVIFNWSKVEPDEDNFCLSVGVIKAKCFTRKKSFRTKRTSY